jgi:hypothetical protein
LVHHEAFATVHEAAKREKSFKSGGGRRRLKAIVDGINKG